MQEAPVAYFKVEFGSYPETLRKDLKNKRSNMAKI